MRRKGLTQIKLLTVIMVLAIISIMPRTIMNEKHEVLESSISVYTKEEIDNLLATLRNSITINTNEITNIKNEISTLNSSLTNYALKSEINITNSYIDDLNTIIANNTSRIEALENNGHLNEQDVVNQIVDALNGSVYDINKEMTFSEVISTISSKYPSSYYLIENGKFNTDVATNATNSGFSLSGTKASYTFTNTTSWGTYTGVVSRASINNINNISYYSKMTINLQQVCSNYSTAGGGSSYIYVYKNGVTQIGTETLSCDYTSKVLEIDLSQSEPTDFVNIIYSSNSTGSFTQALHITSIVLSK